MKTLFFAATLALASSAVAAPAASPLVRPKLILALSVDQYSSEVFNRYRLSYTGGLRTLSHGIAYPVAYQSHASTETCPGHSTILTGRYPTNNGIIANSWYDRSTGKSVYCVSVPGERDPARGPQNMRATTLGDWIKATEPGARSFAVSGKDRAAITMAGQHADGVYWWNDGTGFGTSRFAGPATAAITDPADRFNSALAQKWRAQPPRLWPEASKSCAALQKGYRFGELDLSGRVPPEMAQGVTDGADFLARDSFHEALRTSPTLDSLTADFAIDLIAREKLGKGPATDVLAVSFSATDYIGHRLGNGGAEMCVQQAALDATVGRLLAAVDKLGVPVMVVLTADHGASDAAEREHDHDAQASRLDGRGFLRRLNAELKSDLALPGDPIVNGDADQLVIDPKADPATAGRIRTAAIAWLRQQPEVKEVYSRADVEATTVPPGTTPDRFTTLQRLRLSYDPQRSGDIMVVFGARTSFGIPRKPGDTIAGHGTPWDYDRQVPILFWWKGAPSESRSAPAQVVDIAPTLAAIAGIAPGQSVDGQCLDLGGNCRR